MSENLPVPQGLRFSSDAKSPIQDFIQCAPLVCQLMQKIKVLFLLHTVASQYGQEAVVEYLIQNKANLEAQNNEGKSSLMVAKENGHETIVKQLMDNGATLPLE